MFHWLANRLIVLRAALCWAGLHGTVFLASGGEAIGLAFKPSVIFVTITAALVVLIARQQDETLLSANLGVSPVQTPAIAILIAGSLEIVLHAFAGSA